MAKQNNSGKKKSSGSSSKSAKKSQKKSVAAPRSRENFWKAHLWELLILFLLPFVLYGSTVGYEYVLDDAIVYSENAYVKQGTEGLGDIFQRESFTGYLVEQGRDPNADLVSGARYRPLSIANFALEHELWGLDPGPSHLVNVLFYALTCLLLFRVLHFIAPPSKETSWYAALPFLASLLFLAHPVHTEVVANIKGRDEIMALLLSLATFYYVFRYLQSKQVLHIGLACGVFFLAILAKENSLTFLGVIPLALLLLTRIPRKRYIEILAPLGGVVVVYLLVRVDVIGFLFSGKEITALMNNPFVEASSGEKYATITYTLGRYLGLSFFPHPLTHDYYPYHIPIVQWGHPGVILALLAHIGLIALAIWQRNKSRILTFSIGLYFMTLFITSNIPFPVGTFMNERFLFMPSVGVCLALAYVLVRLLPRWQANLRMAGLALGALVVVGFTVKSFARIPDWTNEYTLNAAAIEVSENSARANQFYAYSLYTAYVSTRDSSKAAGVPVDRELQMRRLETALPYVTKALEIHPTYSQSLECKGGVLAGYIEMGQPLDVVMEEFVQVATSDLQIPFNDLFLRYANSRGQAPDAMVSFYHRVGYAHWWVQKRNAELARKYLNYGLQVVPGHPELTADLAAVNAGQ